MRDFSKFKRVVIKIGTNTLSRDNGIDTSYFKKVASQVKQLKEKGLQVVIVTSGSIGMGAMQLGYKTKVSGVKMRQACAAIGQPLLMQEYRIAFLELGMMVAQVLLTARVLNNRKSYLNLRNAMETLLHLGVVPVINENDCVSTAEIGNAFGDNDTLSALVASKMDADLLIMLSDIDALYTRDPRKHDDAEIISVVHGITDEIEQSAGDSGSQFSTGGMRTKISAAKILHNTGCKMVLANGREENIISRVAEGEEIGTLFMPKRKLGNRIRWIMNSRPAGSIIVDEGALKAIRARKSLLPSGIVSVEGVFDAGSVVAINHQARAVVNFSSDELKQLIGKHSSDIRKILGPERRDVVAVPEDIVFLDM